MLSLHGPVKGSRNSCQVSPELRDGERRYSIGFYFLHPLQDEGSCRYGVITNGPRAYWLLDPRPPKA